MNIIFLIQCLFRANLEILRYSDVYLSMELELVIGTIRKGIKSTIKMHILIFDIGFQEKVKKYFLFSAIFA